MDHCIEAGLSTHEARNTDQAIRILERHCGIRVLFTDIAMEGTMDGPRRAYAVRERPPPVSIMITAGRRKVTVEDLPDNGLFFAKTYTPDEIVKALNRIAGRIAPRADLGGNGRADRRRRRAGGWRFVQRGGRHPTCRTPGSGGYTGASADPTDFADYC